MLKYKYETWNGYEALKGKRLIDIKLVYEKAFGNETDFVTKMTELGVFDYEEM